MPNLQEILEKKDFIIEMANFFGCENVRIYNTPNDKSLNLLTSRIKAKKNYRLAFEAALSHILDCQIVVLGEENLKELYKEDVLENSIPIENSEAIANSFMIPLTEVNFPSASADKKYQIAQKNALNLADRITLEQKQQNLTDFFNPKKIREPNSTINNEVQNNTFNATVEEINIIPQKRNPDENELNSKIKKFVDDSYNNFLNMIGGIDPKVNEYAINKFISGFQEKAKKEMNTDQEDTFKNCTPNISIY